MTAPVLLIDCILATLKQEKTATAQDLSLFVGEDRVKIEDELRKLKKKGVVRSTPASTNEHEGYVAVQPALDNMIEARRR